MALCALVTSAASAQTDYYNTDSGHPLAIEDAYAIELFALELRPASLSLSRHTGGVYALEVESEVSYGVLPRTQVEGKLAWRRAERGSTYESGISGAVIGLLHNLNAETLTLPALALSGELLLPGGSMGADERYLTLKALATRSFPLARIHLSVGYAFGDSPTRIVLAHGVQAEVPRWSAGVAIDKALALRSVLLSAEFVAERPTLAAHPTILELAGGIRWQWTPRIVADVGIVRHLTGDDRELALRLGGSYALGLHF